MPGETARDTGLSTVAEIKRGLYECIDRFHGELVTRSASINEISELFEAISTNTLINFDEHQLKAPIERLCAAYDEISATELSLEIPRLRRHLRTANFDLENIARPPPGDKTWRAIEFLEFVIKYDFVEYVPNISLSLRLFLTICVSVASCERSFSKLS